jgi:thiamine monophosphate kinase
LLFTAPPRTRVPARFEGTPLTRIGTIEKGRAGTVLLDGAPVKPLGYDHFRRRMKT